MTLQLPTGTVTFLFTDIEGSAALAQAYPAALPALLARHNALVRQSIEARRGLVFRVVGDAFCAAFHTAAEAVQSALDAQRALQHEPWAPAAIRVRMGLHTGAAQAGALGDDSESYTGYLTLTRAQRVMAAGHGEQVLLSDATAKLMAGELPAEAALRDLGEQSLKGMLQPERLWQLTAPDLRGDFPPLATAKRVPHNLPGPVTSFIGRERELAEAQRLLAGTRLLTLTGPGGTGKTRLSLQLAADVLDGFSDGVWLVELAALADPALVAQTVAAAWALHEQPGRPLIDTLTDYLRSKTLLLILDNCEHLLDACAQLASALLPACPKLKILTSSREALGVAGETAYRVPSLSLPDAHQSPALEHGADYEAVRLFVVRAQAVQPAFALTSANLPVVVQICRRLDGIPLALELAAARVKVLAVEQIAERLDDRFRLLTGGSRTALPRQQTLRALIDWSYDLLPPAECRAVNWLSVFSGGWTLEAAEALLGPDALDLLAHLVDKSLVVVEQAPTAPAARYRLLETIRQYARDMLLAEGEVEAARDQHLQHYVECAEAAEPRYQGAEILAAIDEMDADLDNLRAALEWALEREPAMAVRLAAALTNFWQRRGRVPEGRRWLRDALTRYHARLPAAGAADEHQRTLRAKALWAAGRLAWSHGEHPEARAAIEEAVALARTIAAPELLVNALTLLVFAAIWENDAARAEAVLEEATRVAQAANYQWGLGMLKGAQSEFARRMRGDYAAAEISAKASVQFLREQGNPWIVAIVIMGLGVGASMQGRPDEARAWLAESEMLYRQLRDRQMVNAVLSERAHLERRQGHYAPALALYARSIVGWQELGHPAAVAHQLECLAVIAAAQAQAEQAARLLGAAEALRSDAKAPLEGRERAEYDKHVAALRTQLDAPTLEAAWAQGRTMNMEAAIAAALEGAANA